MPVTVLPVVMGLSIPGECRLGQRKIFTAAWRAATIVGSVDVWLLNPSVWLTPVMGVWYVLYTLSCSMYGSRSKAQVWRFWPPPDRGYGNFPTASWCECMAMPSCFKLL